MSAGYENIGCECFHIFHIIFFLNIGIENKTRNNIKSLSKIQYLFTYLFITQ